MWDENEKFAEYYDLIFSHKNYQEECDFIEEARRTNLVPSVDKYKLLDVGCGTGNHALELAKHGKYNVYAFDTAKCMVDIAISKAKSEGIDVKFSHGNITDYRGQNFDIIICMFNIIGFLPSFTEVVDFFKNIREAMSKDGILIFDCWNGIEVLKTGPESRLRIFDTEHGKIYRYVEPEFNNLEQEALLKYHCLVVKDNAVVDEFTSNHRIRFYTPRQIRNVLDFSGFKIEETADENWTTTYVVSLIN